MKKQLLALISLSLLLNSCWEKTTPVNFVRPVKLAKVKSLSSYDKDFVGVVSAEQYTNLAFRVGGQVTKIYINEGSFVKRGQLLAEIDPADIAVQSEADKAQYQASKSILERNERLLEKQAISVQDAEIARANFQKAKSAYEYSINQLSYTKLTSPFEGSIEKKYVENFQKVQNGETIFKLINPDILEVKFTLPESDVNITQAVTSYFIEFDNYRGENFTAKIKEIVDASVDGAGIPVTLAITDKNFKPEKYNIKAGFACRIKVQVENQKAIAQYSIIPVTAIFAEGTNSTDKFVWVYNSETKTVVKRKVSTDGLQGSDTIIISAGLEPGEEIVVAGVYQLVDNQPVTVL